jgi:hypothetical protein
MRAHVFQAVVGRVAKYPAELVPGGRSVEKIVGGQKRMLHNMGLCSMPTGRGQILRALGGSPG